MTNCSKQYELCVLALKGWGQEARLDEVVCSDKLRHNTGKGTPVTAELVGMHMVKPLRAWFSCSTAVEGAAVITHIFINVSNVLKHNKNLTLNH